VSKLATNVDLPRFQLQVDDVIFDQDDARVRVSNYLDSILACVGTTCNRRGIDLLTSGSADLLSRELVPVLQGLEQDPSMACAVGILKCSTQSVIAPFVIALKRACAAYPFNSVPNSWSCTVLTQGNADMILVRHEKKERGREPHTYTMRWCVDFGVARSTGHLVHTSARVIEIDVLSHDPRIADVFNHAFSARPSH
jgi:hypothetical protein